MEKFEKLTAVAAPMGIPNVDTDAIIPKQFLKTIKRAGLGKALFSERRYNDNGEERSDFVLNQGPFRKARILVAGENFGCGSSREHAAWALYDFGIRALIAPSFADIFYGNCLKNDMLPIRLDERIVQSLFDLVASVPGLRMMIDLEAQRIQPVGFDAIPFDIEPERKRRLLSGLDDVALTLQQAERIREYERARRAAEPWLFG
jgi:3-isopropylmalate/(R)-2-methylmalate dehydratase small subunit